MDVAYDETDGIAVGINFWGMTEAEAAGFGNYHLCFIGGPV